MFVPALPLDKLWFVRLFQVKIEREQYQTEIRDLQDQLSEMHDELDTAKKSVPDGEKDVMMVVKQNISFCSKVVEHVPAGN